MSLERRGSLGADSLVFDSRLLRVANEFDEIPREKHPKTVAVVLDGNGRWATEHGTSIEEGHKAGKEAGIKVSIPFINLGINVIPWILSPDNHNKRSAREIDNILHLTNDTVLGLLGQFGDKIKIIHLGRKEPLINPQNGKTIVPGLPDYLNETLQTAEDKTKNNTGSIIGVGVNYSGGDELVRIEQRFNNAKKRGEIHPDMPLTRDLILKLGDDGGELGETDLWIRTGGERRTSAFGFRADYAEFYITSKKLPDMGITDVMLALIAYSKRDIRRGGRPNLASK